MSAAGLFFFSVLCTLCDRQDWERLFTIDPTPHRHHSRHRHHSHLLVMNEVFVIDTTMSSAFTSRLVNTRAKKQWPRRFDENGSLNLIFKCSQWQEQYLKYIIYMSQS